MKVVTPRTPRFLVEVPGQEIEVRDWEIVDRGRRNVQEEREATAEELLIREEPVV